MALPAGAGVCMRVCVSTKRYLWCRCKRQTRVGHFRTRIVCLPVRLTVVLGSTAGTRAPRLPSARPRLTSEPPRHRAAAPQHLTPAHTFAARQVRLAKMALADRAAGIAALQEVLQLTRAVEAQLASGLRS